MKNIFLIVVMTYVSFFVNAQTKETLSGSLKETNEQLVWNPLLEVPSNSLYLRFTGSDDSLLMQLRWIRPHDTIAILQGNKRLILKLINGDMLNFSNPEQVVSSRGGGSEENTADTSLGLTVTLVGKDIYKLGEEALIDKIRIQTNKSWFEFSLDNEKAVGIREAFRLFRQTSTH